VGKAVCTCKSCIGRRSQSKGRKRQREVRKALNLRREKFSGRTGNEENWFASNLRFEVKSGKQVESVAVRYVAARNQSDAARAIGDLRPFVFVAAPDGSQPLVVVRADELERVVEAFMEEWSEGEVGRLKGDQ
jgi:hypothetical protein